MFSNFVKTYNKEYDLNEYHQRFSIFKQNLAIVEKMNAESDNKVFGVTKFMDLTPEEFQRTYLMPKGFIKNRQAALNLNKDDVLTPKIINAPDTFDWRGKGAVTAVKDQGQCGSCWAFSATENIESVWILAGHGNNKTTILSPQQIVDCDTQDDGCGGGDLPTAYDYVVKNGLENEDDYPYQANDGRCQYNKAKVNAKLSAWKYATTNSDEKTMQANLVSWAPLAICVDAAKWQYYRTGVYSHLNCGNDLDHCVQLIGYGNDNGNYWIVRNSWDTDWGMDGYILLEMGHDTCGCADEAVTGIAA